MEGWDNLESNFASFSAISRCDLECIEVTFKTNGPDGGSSLAPAFALFRTGDKLLPLFPCCEELGWLLSFTRYTYENPPVARHRCFCERLESQALFENEVGVQECVTYPLQATS